MLRLLCFSAFIFLYLNLQSTQAQNLNFDDLRSQHIPKYLSGPEIKFLAKLSNVEYMEEVLNNTLKPRIVGTDSHEDVFKYIVKELKNRDWHVDIDEFKHKLDFGVYTFKNIVGSLNPDAERFLVLACHYDSKYVGDEKFIAATDGAVPCAMLLNLITVLEERLLKIRNHTDLSLKLIFFDGAETFGTLNVSNAIYGANHLAQVYTDVHANETVTEMDKIDLFVLLNLIGVPEPTFYSYFNSSERWYTRMFFTEECLKDLKQLEGSAKSSEKRYFEPRSLSTEYIADHSPFLNEGVPVLLLIPHSFPKTWHTAADNRESLDPDTIEDLNKILRVFVTEYLHLAVHII